MHLSSQDCSFILLWRLVWWFNVKIHKAKDKIHTPQPLSPQPPPHCVPYFSNFLPPSDFILALGISSLCCVGPRITRANHGTSAVNSFCTYGKSFQRACRQRTTTLWMCSSLLRARTVFISRWAFLSSEQDEGVTWPWRPETRTEVSDNLRSMYLRQSHQMECTDTPVSPTLDVLELKHRCTKWFDQIQKAYQGHRGCNCFRSLCPVLYCKTKILQYHCFSQNSFPRVSYLVLLTFTVKKLV